MTVFERIRRISRSQFYSIQEESIRMSKSIRQLSRKLYREYRVRKSEAEASIARLRMLESKVLELSEKAAEWGSIAADAVKKGKDAIAQDALGKKNDLKPRIEEYIRRMESQRILSTRLEKLAADVKTQLSALTGDSAFNEREADFDRRLQSEPDSKNNGTSADM